MERQEHFGHLRLQNCIQGREMGKAEEIKTLQVCRNFPDIASMLPN